MASMESRDTIPCPGADVMCAHCGGTAVALYGLNVFEPNACSQCGHPGRLERDSTGGFYWALLTGKCAESRCDECRNEVSGLSLAVEFAGIEPLTIPTAAQLIEQAEANAVALRCPVSVALRALVDDIDRQLSRGRTALAQVAAEAARNVARKEIA